MRILAAMIVALAFGTVLPAAAQNAAPGDVGLGKRLYQDKATCGFCHGWSGDGAGDPQSPGKAANLRESKLDHDQLVEVIRCGVPGGTVNVSWWMIWSPASNSGTMKCTVAP